MIIFELRYINKKIVPMEFTPLYQTTLIPKIPGIINSNFSNVQKYLDVFYDSERGLIISPVETTGRIKGSTGEFVSLVVDNLTVKSQYTNLYENVTTANYDYYIAYTGIAAPLRDPCTASSFWPSEDPSCKYIDVEKAYYKILPDIPVALNTDLKSQIVQLILDPSGATSGTYSILIDPSTEKYLNIPFDPSSLIYGTNAVWVSLFCIDYDASFGASWEVYEFGDAGAGGAGDSGSGITSTWVDTQIANAISPFTTNLTTIPVTYATNASLYGLFSTNVSINTALGFYATNVSVNTALGFRDASITFLFGRKNIDEASIGVLTLRHNFTETSLGILDTSLKAYATNASVGIALRPFATNSSVGLALLTNASLGNLTSKHNITESSLGVLTSRHNFTETSLGILTNKINIIDSSITYINANFIPSVSLGSDFNWESGFLEVSLGSLSGLSAFATNSSVNLAFLTNASLGNLTSKQNITEASLGVLTSRHNFTETSLGVLTLRHNFTETSLGILDTSLKAYATNASVGIALRPFATNSSVGLALTNYTTYIYVDVSLNNLRAVPISDACLGGGLSWSNGTLYVDISTIAGGVSLSYVDGSLLYRDTSIRNIYIDLKSYATNSSIGISSVKYISDPSLSNDFIWNNGYLEASLSSIMGLDAFATNSSVNLAFLTNASLGNLTSKQNMTEASLGVLTSRHNFTETSLGILDTSLKSYATNASVNFAFLTNASLGNLSQLTYALNSSLGLKADQIYVDGSLALKTDFTYDIKQDASIGLKADQTYVDGSLNGKTNFTYSVKQDASIGLKADQIYVDGSLALKTDFTYDIKQDASIGLKADLTYVDGSLVNYATNASVNSALILKQNVGDYIKSSSVGTTLYWNDDVFDVSLGATFATIEYVDGSLYDDQNQINSLSNRITTLESSTGHVTFSYVDSSLLKRDSSINNLYSNIASLNASFGTYATNVSVNTAFASNASIGRIDASLRIIYPLIFKINASLGNLTQTKFDACIGYLTSRFFVLENSTFYWKTYVDGSMSILSGSISTLNSQIGTLTSRYNITETSVGYILNNYLKNASLNMSTFKFVAGLLEPSVSSSGVTSLSALTDVSIIDISSNDYLRYNYILGKWVNERTVEASTYYYTKSQIDASFALITSSGVTSLSALTDVSIVSISDDNLLQYDSSWNKWLNVTPIEFDNYFYTKSQIDASFALITSSGITALNALTDVSIVDISSNDYLRYNYILGKWVNERTVEASTYYYTKSQIDASFALITSSGITALNALTDVSIIDVSDNDYLSYNYTLGKWVNERSLEASTYYYTKSQIDASFALITSLGTYFKESSFNMSTFKFVAGLLEPSASLSGVTSLSALTDVSIKSVANNNLLKYDSSFNKWMNVSPLDSSEYFYTKTESDIIFVKNASLGTGFIYTAGILNVDVSVVAGGVTKEYVDGSLSYIKQTYIPEVSLNDSYFKWNGGLLEPSVAGGTADVTKAYVDGSIANFATNASVNLAFLTNASLGSSVSLTNYINDSSLNESTFKWTAGLLEPSVAGSGTTSLSALTSDVSITDASNNHILQFDSSWNKWLNVAPVEFSEYFYTRSETDASFALITSINSSLNIISSSIKSKTVQLLTISASTATFNMNISYNAKIILTQNVSLNVTNASSGDSGTIIVVQDGSGNRSLDLPALSLKNNAWSLSGTSNAIDIISFLYDGSNYYWNKGGAYA